MRNDYELRNRERYDATGGRVGMPIMLPTSGVFWSRGWRGCDRCGGDLKGEVHLQPFTERRGNLIVSGWRCVP